MDAMVNRKGEEGKRFFRSDRFYSAEGSFYFSTREGFEVGPYPSRQDAHNGLELYLDYLNPDCSNSSAAAKVAVQGLWALSKAM